MEKNLWPVASFFVLLLCAFGRRDNVRRYELNGYAQGTTYSIVYYAADSLISQRQTDRPTEKSKREEEPSTVKYRQ